MSFLSLIFSVSIFFPNSLSSDNKLPDCYVCKDFIRNFQKCLDETEVKNYLGGTSVEGRKNIPPYKDSELRFFEIHENLCSSSSFKHKCMEILDKYEDEIENWFFNLRNQDVDLHKHLCIDVMKMCCPKNHFGKDCQVCPEYIENRMCSGHGSCRGDETREGNGTCDCFPGYSGSNCSECSKGFFRADGGICLECHPSCDGECTDDKVENCMGGCRSGWFKNETGICEDIDECSSQDPVCKPSQFCVNTPGKYECKECHPSCESCTGEEETQCLECKKGFTREEDACKDIDECADGSANCKNRQFCVNKFGSYSCKKCHSACERGCKGPLIEDCLDCAQGYNIKEDGSGCEDIDECTDETHDCGEGKFCVNKPGSFSCKSCSSACHHCFGPSPSSCLSCSEGYILENNICKLSSRPAHHFEDSEERDDL